MLKNPERWRRLADQLTIAFSANCCGAALYLALYPSFYYMQWFFIGVWAWGLALIALCCCSLVLTFLGRGEAGTAPPSRVGSAGFVLGMMVVSTLLVSFKVPLRASFLLARPGLEQALAENGDDLSPIGTTSYDFGLYQIRRAHRGCHHEDRVYFQFRDDSESAIIYSESGIDDLCYNSGSKGHLAGNWYWMKED